MKVRVSLLSLVAAVALPWSLAAQFGPQGPPPPPPPANEATATDLTGYWVSVITEDWRWRMLTPEKGDVTSIPMNAEGRKVANAWDPAADEKAGQQCKAYGAPGLMRLPTRLHITWQDAETLKIETDEGTQTRLLRFKAPAPQGQAPSLQGYSAAEWDIRRAAGAFGLRPPDPDAPKPPASLKVVTTHLAPGYLRKNGVPYSADAVLTEYFSRTDEPNGDVWLILTSIVEDPKYLNSVFLTSSHFKKEPDGSKWDPSPCRAR